MMIPFVRSITGHHYPVTTIVLIALNALVFACWQASDWPRGRELLDRLRKAQPAYQDWCDLSESWYQLTVAGDGEGARLVLAGVDETMLDNEGRRLRQRLLAKVNASTPCTQV